MSPAIDDNPLKPKFTAMIVVLIFYELMQRMGNRERGTGNRERGIGNGESGNGEQSIVSRHTLPIKRATLDRL